MLRVAAGRGLASKQFREGPLYVVEDKWSSVDPDDEKIREVLLARAPRHVRFAPNQEAALAEAGLTMRDGVLVDLRAKKKESAKPTK